MLEEVKPKIKNVITSVYDSKVKQHLAPITSRTTEEAIRAFGAAAKQENHDFKNFASDYTLWILGYYYPETGLIEACNRMQISSASEFTN